MSDWARPEFRPGGGEAFVFLLAFGDIDISTPLGKTAYRSEGVPDGFELLQFHRDRQSESYRDFLLDRAFRLAEKESPELAVSAREGPYCVLLRGLAHDPPTLDYLRASVGVVAYLVDRGATVVFDPQIFQFWDAATWKATVFDPARPVPHEHVVILASPMNDAKLAGPVWYHTRGMRTFGRPDLSVKDVGPQWQLAVAELFNRFIEHQALGAVIPEGKTIRFGDLPPGGECRHAGGADDPHFHNAHVELAWPRGALR